MAGRYELSDHSWSLIKDIVSPHQSMGRPRRDDRQVLNGIFWVLCSGAKWRDLPERYGPWSTVYARFRQWRDDGTFDAVLARLQLKLREDGLMDLDTWMVDATAVRATRAASGGGKKGGTDEPVDHALGRSRGGLLRNTSWVPVIFGSSTFYVDLSDWPSSGPPAGSGQTRMKRRRPGFCIHLFFIITSQPLIHTKTDYHQNS